MQNALLHRLLREPIFYGNFIVAAGFFALFVSMGARNGLGVFIKEMEADRIWDNRAEISAVIAIGTMVNALTQPFLGRLYDRYGARIVISASLLVLGIATLTLTFAGLVIPDFGIDIAFPGFSIGITPLPGLLDFNIGVGAFTYTLTSSLIYLILIYGFVMSTASSGVSLVTVHSVLSKWFYRKRGMMLSIATSGASVGGMLLTPFASFLIASAHWRIAWIALALFVLLLALPIVLIIMRDTPSEVGERPDGDKSDPTPAANGRAADSARAIAKAPLETDRWKSALRSPPFLQLSGAYFVCGVTTIIISAHYVPFALDLGISQGVAGLAFGFMQGLNAVGVLVVGFLADKFSRKNLLGTIYFIRFLAYVMLVAPGFAGQLWGVSIPPSIAIWGFAALAGVSWIATPPLTSSLTADIYGVRHIGTLNGLSTMSHQIGGSISVFMAGVLYVVYGAYEIPFALAGLTLLGATLASYAVNERKFSIRYQPAPAAATAAAGKAD